MALSPPLAKGTRRTRPYGCTPTRDTPWWLQWFFHPILGYLQWNSIQDALWQSTLAEKKRIFMEPIVAITIIGKIFPLIQNGCFFWLFFAALHARRTKSYILPARSVNGVFNNPPECSWSTCCNGSCHVRLVVVFISICVQPTRPYTGCAMKTHRNFCFGFAWISFLRNCTPYQILSNPKEYHFPMWGTNYWWDREHRN